MPFPSPPSALASADPAPSSRFADVGDRLNASASSPPRAAHTLDDLRRSLKTFCNSHSTTSSSFSTTESSTTPSFVNVFANTNPEAASVRPSSSSPFSFAALRDSLRKPGPAVSGARPFDWKPLASHPQRPAASSLLPKEKVGMKGPGFLRQYTDDEMGKRLHALRPTGAGKDEQ